MSKKRAVPEVRFKGFEGEWEERALGEIGSFKNGMNFSKDAMGHGFPFVNLQDVFGKKVVDDKTLGLAYSNEVQRKNYSLKEGDVLFIRSSVKAEGVGETALIDKNLKNTTYSGFIIRFRSELDMCNSYKTIAFRTSQVRKQILEKASSSANTNINQESLSNIILHLPHIKEQTRIGEFFRKLDTRITLEQRKYEKLQNIKKAMLEKMFPKPGATVPEVRFKGFSGEWEEKKLGNLSSNFQSGEFIKANEIVQNGPYPVFGGNGLRGYANTYNHDGEFTLIGRQGALCGNVKYIFEQAYITEHAVAVSANSESNTLFLYYLFGTMNLGQYSGQSAQPGLAVGNLILLNRLIPKKTEQTRIGEFFRNLDRLISLQQRKCEKMQNIKKAMLGKMFV